MAQIAYVNGQYVPQYAAQVHIEDRGYQFADGIYEVCLVINGAYWDKNEHLDRMDRSLNELGIEPPMPRGPLTVVMNELLRRNRLKDALVYIQVTRGVAPRNHPFPPPETPPALVMTAKPFDLDASDALAAKGVSVITGPDIRWGRVDIKSVSLLAKRAGETGGGGTTGGRVLAGSRRQGDGRLVLQRLDCRSGWRTDYSPEGL